MYKNETAVIYELNAASCAVQHNTTTADGSSQYKTLQNKRNGGIFMFKKTLALLLAALMIFSLAACGNSSPQEASNSSTDNISEQEQAVTDETESTDESVNAASAVGTVDNTLAEDEDMLIATYADKFEQKTYTDSDTGLSITYNLYLPKGYDASESYPMVVFIGDSSCTGNDATVSLTQGRGGLVWAAEAWQSVYPTIVAVPTYSEMVLDDHGSYTTTEYVELTKRYIDYMSGEYAVDTDRIYGTGQSMGCMITLILASEHPDLYAACMFVDGQWDISTLTGLENQTFVYFAAEDDASAWNGAQEVMSMFDDDSVSYEYAQWDGNWSVDELSAAAQKLFTADENHYFISWATGTIEPKSGGMGGSDTQGGNFRGFRDSGEKPSDGFEGHGNSNEKLFGGFGGPDGNGESTHMGDGMSSGINSSSYHMASFDYAYNCIAVMEWLFKQTK